MAAKKSGGYGELIRTVVIACAIALGIRTFFYEPFNIPSGSMIPTLLVGDYLFVSKASYGYSRYSLPLALPLIPGRVLFTPPERGDVVVFKLPSDNSTDYIKRIVGLPGDTVQVKGGILHINGAAVKRRQIEDFQPENGARPVAQFIETLPNGREHRILELSDTMSADNTPVYHVPAGHYFAMGDNRDNSRDSRFPEVGPIPEQNLVGRADILFFSHDGDARLWEVWKWPFAIRYGRLLDGIE
ncbi:MULTISPECIES: signal peptidase I [Thalassobaculum]|mgnify:CR=1 FL=1|uniref:Signal peptidase I n=1 Tax=Thalassobaculum litoreum DSM 18839 TaxID=1123362 RepID=A0A8G2BEG5_9PROT|nr:MULTISPECIES: signal peptidase I [Thalassobaculum]SDF14874.1 signal peptidase I [Thalassobaculum litoreum DSM 18839]